MNSSSVYSIGDSIYKRATQLYNDYISKDQKVQEDILQEINHEIIFSKNNVCIHLSNLSESYRTQISSNACSNNCLPGYFSIKLIKSKSEEQQNKNEFNIQENLKRLDQLNIKIDETSFIVKEEFDLNKVIKENDDQNELNMNKEQNESIKSCKDESNENFQKKSSSYLKQQEIKSDQSTFYSMIVNWIPNLIFEKKPNKLSRNLSLKSTNSMNKSLNEIKKCHSLNNLNSNENLNAKKSKPNHQNHLNQLNKRSYSDSQLNLVSKCLHKSTSNDTLINEENLIFNIDIKHVKSLKLFFGSQLNKTQSNDELKQDAQLVISNYGLQYKIFHFHNDGLIKLEKFLDDWNFVFYKQKNFKSSFTNFFENLYDESNLFNSDTNDNLIDFYRNKFIQLKNQNQLNKESNNNQISCIQLYSINLPALNYLDLHNEGSTYQPLSIQNLDDYNQFFNSKGQLYYDFDKLKLRCFFKGCEAESRKYFWPYLLNRFSPNLTNQEKNEIKKHGHFLYNSCIDEKRKTINKNDNFYRKFIQYQSTIKEDVPRTDRNNKVLQDKSKLKIMERILLNYTLYSKTYSQGFSDLLAPLITILIDNEPESEIFFNFVYLLEKKNFFCLPNDDSIDDCIAKIRELLRILDFKIYDYFKQLGELAFQLLFTHRWMLLCFRREFSQDSALKIWESCFSEFQFQFQLFICISIIQIYGTELIEKQFNSDDILFYFGNLSHKMNADTVMKKARSNLFQFRSLTNVPCTLRTLCNYKSKSTNQSWTIQLQPFFECVRSNDNPDSILLCKCDKK